MGQVAIIQPQQAIAPSFSMSDMETIANAIARGGLFGSKDPYAVLTLCMLAQAEGKHPAIVFRDYDLIQGKPAKKAQAMQTDFLAAGGKVEWHQLDDTCADATFSHPAGGTARISWDMDRAKTAGLSGKDMWKKFPRQMLRARVISEGVRTVFPGATSGLYESSEVADIVQDGSSATPATPTPQRARDLKQITGQPTDANRDKAEAWASLQVAAIAEAPDLAALETLCDKAAKGMAKLEKEHPDLHAQVRAACDARRLALEDQPATGTPSADAEPSNSSPEVADGDFIPMDEEPV